MPRSLRTRPPSTSRTQRAVLRDEGAIEWEWVSAGADRDRPDTHTVGEYVQSDYVSIPNHWIVDSEEPDGPMVPMRPVSRAIMQKTERIEDMPPKPKRLFHCLACSRRFTHSGTANRHARVQTGRDKDHVYCPVIRRTGRSLGVKDCTGNNCKLCKLADDKAAAATAKDLTPSRSPSPVAGPSNQPDVADDMMSDVTDPAPEPEASQPPAPTSRPDPVEAAKSTWTARCAELRSAEEDLLHDDLSPPARAALRKKIKRLKKAVGMAKRSLDRLI